MSARENEAFDNLQGKFFSSHDANEVILLNDFAKELEPQDPKSLIGKEVTLRYGEHQQLAADPGSAGTPDVSGEQNTAPGAGDGYGFSVVRKTQQLKVVGIVDEEPYGGMRTVSRGRIYLPVDFTEKLDMAEFSDMRSSLRGSGRTYATLTVRVKDPAKVAQVEDAIKSMDFRTFSVLDATKSLRRFFTVLDLFLGIFGSLALIVATLAIINTLVMAVLERRREIGVMKAIGASDRDVKSLFFAEAGAMGFLGGVLGIGLGCAIGKAINVGTGIYLHNHQLPAEAVWVLPTQLIGWFMAFSIGVSLLAGWYPARRAARLDPVQTLKYE